MWSWGDFDGGRAAEDAFADADAKRLVNYIEVFDDFSLNKTLSAKNSHKATQIVLIVDSLGMNKPAFKQSVNAAISGGKLAHVKWKDFLYSRKEEQGEQFLEASDKARRESKEGEVRG